MLGVCGGIAAYKAVEVCRRLIDAGAHVSPVLTGGATRFVGELTFSALGSERAQTSLWDGPSPIPHTRLGQKADLIIVVPATARLIGAYAAGISSDLLTATLLATRAPVLVCPAMHTEMWEHPAVAENVATLVRRHVHVVAPVTGHLAGGDEGQGRLAEPVDIVAAATRLLAARSELAGLHALVTAGGTREPIDAVRYVGNRSSGKQGHAVAEQLAQRGATVLLVTTADRPVAPGIAAVWVETAAEMEATVTGRAPSADIIVMAAAVADFRPMTAVAGKLKKEGGVPDLVLEPTTDILAGLGVSRRPGQTLVGFAAETVDPTGRDSASLQALVDLATAKLISKRVDVMVANDVAAPGAGFSHDTNAVVIVDADGVAREVGLADKQRVAAAVVDAVVAYRRSRPAGDETDRGGHR
ncbi:MAG: bifunctional phosphopantothenoylcysteine decarboxylase/phosphopantothenate--cysteine ligase CoaBC [Actinomycetota bacterium]|nr:bifunctional phosphopantothenoylcysteine decarboxylase/phosphopantothenate--cysteine ligase CoaBC [Actinomycetota bacterium]